MQNMQQQPGIIRTLPKFNIGVLTIPYAEFVPKLYNLCLNLGFQKGLIMPSRAFCSDENQGIPIILITKHFGTFPFNHGRVGGIVAIGRHGPHSHHGEDSVIIQASHVGFDPETRTYGTCTRPKMQDNHVSVSCGKISHVLGPYVEQYQFAREHIFLHKDEQENHFISVKNSLIKFSSRPVKDGLALRLEKIAQTSEDGNIQPISATSTFQTYAITDRFKKRINSTGYTWTNGIQNPIRENLTDDLFYFHEDLHETDDSIWLERNLIEFMPSIVTAKSPALEAAKINVQMEFERTVESIRRGTEYNGKNLLFISGVNIDISPYEEYPANTYFVPWAAYIQLRGGTPEEYKHPVEQMALFEKIMEQDIENSDQISLSDQIDRMLKAPRLNIESPK